MGCFEHKLTWLTKNRIVRLKYSLESSLPYVLKLIASGAERD